MMNQIKEKIKVLEEEELENELRDIENKGNNLKAYEAVKLLKKRKPGKKLKVCDEEERQQVEELTKHFKNIFEKENQEQPPQYPPCQNNLPFTKEEIITATRKLKNGKSPGVDEMIAELLKLAPDKVHQIVADVLNTSVETDDYLEIL